MSSNLKLTLSTSHSYEVATLAGGTTTWTPNSSSISADYNAALNGNTVANVNGGEWYYSWYAATAGQGTNTANPTINRSICPKGWRLPLGTQENKSFYNLINATYALPSSSVGVSSLTSDPLSFKKDGYYKASGLTGGDGYYWSATSATNNNAIFLWFSASVITTQNPGNGSKPAGLHVRCVAI